MTEILLDTNVIIDASRKYLSAGVFLNTLDKWNISIVSAFELIYGAKNKVSLNKVNKDLNKFDIIKIDDQIQSLALKILANYKLKNNIEVLDSFIAATALENHMTLVTKNVKHYKDIKGLKIHEPY